MKITLNQGTTNVPTPRKIEDINTPGLYEHSRSGTEHLILVLNPKTKLWFANFNFRNPRVIEFQETVGTMLGDTWIPSIGTMLGDTWIPSNASLTFQGDN